MILLFSAKLLKGTTFSIWRSKSALKILLLTGFLMVILFTAECLKGTTFGRGSKGTTVFSRAPRRCYSLQQSS